MIISAPRTVYSLLIMVIVPWFWLLALIQDLLFFYLFFFGIAMSGLLEDVDHDDRRIMLVSNEQHADG